MRRGDPALVLADVAAEVKALFMVDMAHVAGLVAVGMHPSPVPFADFVTTTTHKTLRGPRGGISMCKESWAKKLDSAVFPGLQGGPLEHVIAGKAAAFAELGVHRLVPFPPAAPEGVARTIDEAREAVAGL